MKKGKIQTGEVRATHGTQWRPHYTLPDNKAHNSALAIWRGDEYIHSFLFAIQLQLQPTNKAEQ